MYERKKFYEFECDAILHAKNVRCVHHHRSLLFLQRSEENGVFPGNAVYV